MKVPYLFPIFVALWMSATEARFPPIYKSREPPVPVMSRNASPKAISTEWIDVPLDQFSSDGNIVFKMRYLTNDQFFVEDGSPIFILLGGEWTISTGWLLGGHMFEIANDVGGYMIYTEHRYYGLTWPANTTETENLKYLVVDQALADVISLINELKTEERFANSKIIVFGGSYAGNMATWIRAKYPEYIDGALASSGPVLAKSDFYEYLETVGDGLRTYGGEECIDAVTRGVEHSRQAIENGDVESVQQAYNLCAPFDHTNELDVQTFFSLITESFAGSVQYGSPSSLQSVCERLQMYEGNDMQRLGGYISESYGGGCYDMTYDDFIQYFGDTSYTDASAYTMRLWFYQTCTEYGYYQTTTSSQQPFGSTLPLSYFVDHLCADLYGPEFDEELLNAGIERTNILYEGLTPNVTKVFSVHGTIDPWHRLGIMEDLNELSPTYVINGTAHCIDLQATNVNDIPELTEARRRVRASIMEWLRD